MHGLMPGPADAPSLRNKCMVHTFTIMQHSIPTQISEDRRVAVRASHVDLKPSPIKLTSPRAARSSKGSSTFLSSEVAPAFVAVADIFMGCRILNAWAAFGANRTAARSNTEARPTSCIVVFWGWEAVECVGDGELAIRKSLAENTKPSKTTRSSIQSFRLQAGPQGPTSESAACCKERRRHALDMGVGGFPTQTVACGMARQVPPRVALLLASCCLFGTHACLRAWPSTALME